MKDSVTTPLGPITGDFINGIYRFLGIPYAKAPIGELRFREPEPLEPWLMPVEAKRYRKDPMQSNKEWDVSHYSEDCLYLNIWVPQSVTVKMPVMVWVPGGAYANGGSGALNPDGPSLYEFDLMVKETNCIIVSISYRLNVFGFLNFSQYSKRFDDNLGMKDIIFALRWIHTCIGAFSGDANNITLFGQSSGAGAISALLLCDAATPYFHKAILQSNCFGSFYTQAEETDITKKYLQYAGLDVSHSEELLNLSYEKLLSAAKKLDSYVLRYYSVRCTFCPVIDYVFLKDFPTLASFSRFEKPVLVGSTRNEGNFQVLAFQWTQEDIEMFCKSIFQRLTPEIGARLRACYPGLPKKQSFADLLTDVMYGIPKIRFAEHLSQHGTVYVYRYDYATPVMESTGLSACHVADLLSLIELKLSPYVALSIGDEETLRKIGSRMRRYWGAFAYNGNPNVDGLLDWEPYDEKGRKTMIFDREDFLVSDAERDQRLCYDNVDRILI